MKIIKSWIACYRKYTGDPPQKLNEFAYQCILLLDNDNIFTSDNIWNIYGLAENEMKNLKDNYMENQT